MVYRFKSMIGLFVVPFVLVIPFFCIGINAYPGTLVGCLAYLLFMWDIILGLRPKWLERFCDLQNLYMVHGVTALMAVLTAALHVWMDDMGGLSGLFGNIAFYLSLVMTVLALIFLTSQLGRVLPFLKKPIEKIKSVANSLGFTRELNWLIHIMAPLVVVFVMLHVLLISWYTGYPPFMMIFVPYTVIFFVIYAYEGIYKKIATTKYEVEDVTVFDNGAYELTMRYQKGPKLDVKGGQFIFIHTKEAKLAEYHPFSVLRVNGDRLTLGIRIAGDYTERLAHITPGEEVKVKGVYGHFVKPKDTKPVVAIGGGIGITPCISLLESLGTNEEGLLIWGLRNQEDVMFMDQIEHLQKTHPNVKVAYHFDDESGFMDAKYLKEVTEGLNQPHYYICGPAKMTDAMVEALKTNSVPKEDIVTEGFIF